MQKKRLLFYLVILCLFSVFVSAQTHYFDYGYSGSSYGDGGFGFLSSVCDNYGDMVDFFVYFIIFFVLGHWVFGQRSKGNILSVVISFALAFTLVRSQSFFGFSLLCGEGMFGYGNPFGSLFGGFAGLLFIVIIILIVIATFKTQSDAVRVGVAIGFLLFRLWLGTEGGYRLSFFFAYLPLDAFFIEMLLNILTFIFILVLIISGYRWISNRG